MEKLSKKPVLDWMLKKVTSKKLWAFVGTAGVTALAAYSGQIPWAIAVPALVNAFLIYAGVEGGVDIARAIAEAQKGKKK